MAFATATPLAALALLAQVPPPAQQPATDWKQGIEYRIEARLDEEAEVLEGWARVLYRNNSPHALDEFYFHLYLNAFRPNSLWARTDLEAGVTTFQELGPDEHAFERVLEMTADGRAVSLRYPFAPDSTVVGFDLPEPLEPGETLTLAYRWNARPSTVPRRQGRQGRQWDFAQWYPRVVVYDDEGWRAHPLYRAGEFYGEFATYDVTMDLADDQVVGSTGVPVEGDPGWQDAAVPGTGPVTHQREWYGTLEGPPCVERGGERICDAFPAKRLPPAEALGLLDSDASSGRKRVRWWAEDVHHFAWSVSPDYVYEQGRYDDVAIHVLYRPGDEESWGGGVAVRRTVVALEWMDRIFGDYAYPHVMNLHRIEGGGTEFPMVIMDGSASQGLILHEVGHIYAHGILANNEWYEGWLDEGLSSFQTDWFNERAGAGPEIWRGDQISTLRMDLRGVSEPVVLPAEDYAEYDVYSAMIYTKGSLVFWMLREMAGEDAFLEILRTYYERYRFRHVDSDAFQSVAEEVLRRDLDWFFGPWLHATGVVDYALRGVEVEPDGQEWTTTVEVERVGERVMPVPVRLRGAGGDSVDAVVEGTDLRGRTALRSIFRPASVEIDPDGAILDWNVANNHWAAAPLAVPEADVELDHPLRPLPTQWRRIPLRWLPLAWFNDAAGWVGGVQLRSSQLGLVDRKLVRIGLPAVEGGDKGGLARRFDPGSIYARVENPVRDDRPRLGTTVEAFAGEGRVYAGWVRRKLETDPPLSGRPAGFRGFASAWWVYDDAYLAPGRWTPGDKVGGEVGLGGEAVLGPEDFFWRLDGFAAAGFDSQDRRWLRAGLSLEGEGEVLDAWRARLRAFAGTALADDPEGGGWDHDAVPRERMYFLAGGDPLAALSNPWVRSRGAPLDEEGFVPGGGELRGFHPGMAVPRLAALGAELATPPLEMAVGDAEWELRGVGFAGLAIGGRLAVAGGPLGVDGAPDPGDVELPDDLADEWRFYGAAGAGLELAPGGSPVRLRLDVPFVVSEPALATRGRDQALGFRWTLAVLGR